MAKQLPQFKAATPAYQQQRIVRQPNYADIYARSYANTVNAYSRLYQPVLGAIDKININILCSLKLRNVHSTLYDNLWEFIKIK